MPATHKWVYHFTEGAAAARSAHGEPRDLLGGKGAGAAEMTRAGMPVPPGFTITTEACRAYYKSKGHFPPGMWEQVTTALKKLEAQSGKKLGDAHNPLLVSVRSGARASMPGMMDTILNLGLNDETARGLAKSSGDQRFAFDSYRRFIQMYSDVVLGIDKEKFEHELFALRDRSGVKTDAQIPGKGLKELIETYKKIVTDHNHQFPQDVNDQLWGAIGAVFSSWNNQRAITYRRLNGIPDDWGTAVNVQAMVFGNMGDDCATGVAFTRDPSDGTRVFYGEYLVNAQGEDVVAGIRTPRPINAHGRVPGTAHLPTLEEEMPRAYRELVRIATRLERHYRDMQD